MRLRLANRVDSAVSVAAAGVNAFVESTDLRVTTIPVGDALDDVASDLRVTSEAGSAGADRLVIDAGAFRVSSAGVRRFARVLAVGRALDIDACRRRWAVTITVVADVLVMATGLASLCEGVSDKIGRASAGVATDDVVTQRRVVAWVSGTLVYVDAEQ